MSELKGKTALITGASRGIGQAIAVELAQCGVSVALAARDASKLNENVATIKSECAGESGVKALAVQCDVARFDAVQNAVATTVRELGSLDILVNNAGVIDPIARLADSDPEGWTRAVDINVKGVYHGLRAAIPIMELQQHGVIVNLSSGAATNALEGWSHYCATKAAVKMLTQCAHKEVDEKGICVVGLSPGTVATDMMATIKSSGVNPVSQLDWSTHIPPQWVAKAVAFLCGPGGKAFAGTDFSIKTDEGRQLVGLPPINA